MRTRQLAITGSVFLMLSGAAARGADAEHPALVELFQSQGCNSCPPAIANLNAIASRPDVLALTYAVDYWDYLGWKDTFAKHKFTERQWDYAHALGRSEVFTPEVVVNGRTDGVGVGKGEIESLIEAADARAGTLDASIAGDRLSIAGAAGSLSADVWVVFYDPNTLKVPIARGENAGRTLAHRNVVRDLLLAGHWSGAAEAIDLPATPPGLKRAVLIQSTAAGQVLLALPG
jgi:hypothetical protein